MGEGMTEAQLKALTQQTAWATFGFLAVVILALYLTSVAPDGRRRGVVWGDRVKRLFGRYVRIAHSVELHDRANDETAARTGAGDDDEDAPHQGAGADGVRGAGVRAEAVIPPGSLVLTPEEIGAVARMVSHKVATPKATKLDTIKAGWPEIKARSGDPLSKYARASAIYEAVFVPPTRQTPVAERAVPDGVEFRPT